VRVVPHGSPRDGIPYTVGSGVALGGAPQTLLPRRPQVAACAYSTDHRSR